MSVLQVVALDCLLEHQSTSALPVSLLATLVQLAIPLCILLFFVLLFCGLHLWRWWWKGAKWDQACLNRRLSIAAYAVLGFFYTSFALAALNQFSCYHIDAPIPSGTPYPHLLQVRPLPLVHPPCSCHAWAMMVCHHPMQARCKRAV